MKILLNVILAALVFTGIQVQAETLNVVVNKAVAIDSLDRKTIRRLYLGKAAKLPSGIKLVPIDIDETDELYEVFSKKVVGKNPAQISSHWSRRIFNGKGTPPRQLADTAQITELIASEKVYVSYVLGDVTSSDLKVVYSVEF